MYYLVNFDELTVDEYGFKHELIEKLNELDDIDSILLFDEQTPLVVKEQNKFSVTEAV